MQKLVSTGGSFFFFDGIDGFSGDLQDLLWKPASFLPP